MILRVCRASLFVWMTLVAVGCPPPAPAASAKFEMPVPEGDSDPQRARWLLDFGQRLEREERYGDAVRVYEEAKVYDPSGVEPYWYIRAVYERAGRLDWSEAEARQGIRRIEGDAARAGMYLQLTSLMFRQKRYDEALAAADQAIRYQPDEHEHYAEKGLILASLNRNDEAERVLLQSLERQPKCPLAASTLAGLYEREERFEEARAMIQRAIDETSDQPDYYEMRDRIDRALTAGSD